MPLAIVEKFIDREKWTGNLKSRVPRPNNHEVLLQSSIRPVSVVAGLFPVFGLMFVVVYGYVFQAERLSTYLRATKCPNITSRLPPISYPMGIWQPQKFIWLLFIIMHVPPRVFYGITYTRFFLRSDSKFTNTWWYRFFIFAYPWVTLLEMISLIMVTVIDQESCFQVHASSCAAFVIMFCSNVFVHAVLHWASGFKNKSRLANALAYFKAGCFVSSFTLAMIMLVTYPYYKRTCSEEAYLTFAIAEYMFVIHNAAFHFTSYFDFPKVKIGLFVDFTEFNEDNSTEKKGARRESLEKNIAPYGYEKQPGN
uniref:Post-GPI attachment to proteins factor 2 n=1 Tax=Plectus sambesii TaxID=2011161 RepID=A0A914XCQ2_9BILA